jgi:succinate dehydrogenase (or fumarate reductase) cytochrome b subunit, b558 family
VTATIERGHATASMPAQAPKATKPTNRKPRGFLGTSNGKKAVLAVTGAVMVLFLVGHVLGNLKIFFGATAFNDYAHWLRHIGEPAVPGRTVLTITEIALTVSVVAHMWAAVSLARRAAKARPVKYVARPKWQAQGYVARTMRYGGVIILLFVIWHLLDLTFAAVNPAGSEGLPYQRMVEGFAPGRWPITLFYLVALVMLGLHLRHGLWSAFQSLGLANGRRYRALRICATTVSTVLMLAFASVPISVMIGVVK